MTLKEKEIYYCSYHKHFIDEDKLMKCISINCKDRESGICRYLFFNYRKYNKLTKHLGEGE